MDIFGDYYSAYCRDFLVLLALKVNIKEKYISDVGKKIDNVPKQVNLVKTRSIATFSRSSRRKEV